jgi:hypothetical protein
VSTFRYVHILVWPYLVGEVPYPFLPCFPVMAPYKQLLLVLLPLTVLNIDPPCSLFNKVKDSKIPRSYFRGEIVYRLFSSRHRT